MNHLTSTLAAIVLAASAIPAVAGQSVKATVNGMVCAFCAQGIEKTLKGFPATAGVFVSLEHRIVAVQLKDGEDINDASLTKAITDAGYKLVAIHRTDETLDAVRSRVLQQKALPTVDPSKHKHAMGAMDGHD